MPQPATRAATGRRWATDPGNRCERDWLRVRLADLRPGWRTDFILHRFGAEVIEREDCLVVRTPCNPTYYWGNCLHLPRLPTESLRVFRSCPLITPKGARSSLQMLAIARAMAALCA